MIERLALLLCGLLSMTTLSAATELEFMHFWQSSGEKSALDLLAKHAQQNNVSLQLTSQAHLQGLQDTVVERFSVGLPPNAFQWHAGAQLKTLHALGLLSPVDELSSVSHLADNLHPFVRQQTFFNQTLLSAPVTVHGDNWAWYNSEIYRELDLAFPHSWQEFLSQAPIIRAAGYSPLVVGPGSWEKRLLFTTILLDVGGAELYRIIAKRERPSATGEEKLREAVQIFMALKPFAQIYSSGNWVQATHAVAKKEAALQIMGDWAKAELLQAGLKIGRDFECKMAPGNQEHYLVVIDTIAFSRTSNPKIEQAQRQLITQLFDPTFQTEFAHLKGSVPTLRTIDIDQLDACAQFGSQQLSATYRTLPNPTLLMTPIDVKALDDTVAALWNTERSTEQAVTHFLRRYVQAKR